MSNLSRRSFIAGSGAAAMALAACANQNASSQSASSAAGDSAAAAATKITFCLDYTPNTNHTGVYVAQSKGYFAEEGLEVEIVQPAEDSAEALIGAGRAQLGVSYQDYIASSYTSGNTGLTAVAAIVQHNTSGIMSRKADGITRPAAMENHSYATWDLPVEQATVKQIVEKDGGDFSKIKLVPYTVDDDVAGLKTNMFDAVWVYEGWAVQNAKVQNVDVNYFSFISIDEVFDYYTPVIAANNDFCKENPDAVRAFLRACKRGYEYAIANAEDAAKILCEAVPELDAALVSASQAFLADQYQAEAKSWGEIDKDRWAAFFTWLNENKLVEGELDVNAGWTMEYLQ
ncbi:MAG: ABC transporter substrate-binding protein [Coriobacteriales bacterium]|nr:ABC transporter substrate-binding protein [Coriobacteriales bacterium]